MRRLLTLTIIAAFALFANTAFAQQQQQQERDMGMQVGVVGAGNMSTFAGDEVEDLTFKPGFGGGVRAIIPFHSNFSVQPEVLFMQRGAAFEEIDDAWISLNYLQVPLLARLDFPIDGGAVIPKILIGPTVGIFLNGTLSINDQEASLDDDDFETLDLAATVGAGVDFEVGRGTISFDARYNQSLLDISTDDLDTFNRAIDVLVGYNFRF